MKGAASVHRWLILDGDPAPVRGLRTTLTSFLRDRGIDDRVQRAVVLAFSEALENAVEHGLVGSCGAVSVRMRYSSKFISVSLRDSGSDKTPLGRPVNQGADAERGRGFKLMHTLMDYVKVRSYPDGGTRVSMLKRLDRPSCS